MIRRDPEITISFAGLTVKQLIEMTGKELSGCFYVNEEIMLETLAHQASEDDQPALVEV